MKCVQRIATGEIDRVRNENASAMVETGTHRYVPKSAWREQNRPKSMSVGRQQAERYAAYAKADPDGIFSANPKAGAKR